MLPVSEEWSLNINNNNYFDTTVNIRKFTQRC